MKRKLLVLLTLGLVMAFSSSVLAADVKFSGNFYVAGMYQDRTTVSKWMYESTSGWDSPSTAFYYQRLRVLAEVVVSPGLSLITRFDAMERDWGAPRAGQGITVLSEIMGAPDSAGSRRENENIAFDWAYIRYASPIGVFTVGYQDDLVWGTKFADNSRPAGKIAWAYTFGGLTLMADVAKLVELSSTAKWNTGLTDSDIDKYSVAAKYAWNKGEAGMKVFYLRALHGVGINTDIYGVVPYAKAKFGPIAVEAEVDYYWGNLVKTDGFKMKLESLGIYVDALADMGMFYAGATFAYLAGDKNLIDDNKIKIMSGGMDWNPTLILFNWERTYWAGVTTGSAWFDVGLWSNAWFYQVRGGVRLIPALDLGASLTYARADKRQLENSLIYIPNAGKDYGWELDVTANYKITNNLSYMLGVGYLWTGKYFVEQGDKALDNYLVINKLTLTF